MRNFLVAFAALVLSGTASARATMMYSDPVEAGVGQQVICDAINTGGQTGALTVSVMDACAGHIEIAYTCTTSLTGPRGCSTTYTVQLSDNNFYYCVIDTQSLAKAAVRGNIKVFDPTTNVVTMFFSAQ